jgi:hypothetical protein
MTEWTLVIATVLGLIAGALVSAADEKFLSHYSNRTTLLTTPMSSEIPRVVAFDVSTHWMRRVRLRAFLAPLSVLKQFLLPVISA